MISELMVVWGKNDKVIDVHFTVGVGMGCVYLKTFRKWSSNLGKGPAKKIIANGAKQTMRSEIPMEDKRRVELTHESPWVMH